jgi:hypothetical protein
MPSRFVEKEPFLAHDTWLDPYGPSKVLRERRSSLAQVKREPAVVVGLHTAIRDAEA